MQSFLLFPILLGRHSDIVLSLIPILSTQRLPQVFPALFTLSSTELFQSAKTLSKFSQTPAYLQDFWTPQKYCAAEQESSSVHVSKFKKQYTGTYKLGLNDSWKITGNAKFFTSTSWPLLIGKHKTREFY